MPVQSLSMAAAALMYPPLRQLGYVGEERIARTGLFRPYIEKSKVSRKARVARG